MTGGLGWRLVLRDPLRSLLAVGGIGVAVLIAFVEMGFLNGVIDSQLRIVAAARGELIAINARRVHLNRWDSLAQIRVRQLAAIAGVAAALPVYQSGYGMRSAPDEPDARVIVLALDAEDPALELGWTAETRQGLRAPGTALFDRLSRPIYGALTPGQDVWLEGHRLKLGGFVSLGPTVVNDGHLVMSTATYRTLNPDADPRMAVLRLAPGAEPARVKQEIARLIGREVSVFTKRELAERESRFLMHAAPLGLLFGAGMTAGLVVGLVICYQVLYVAIRRRLKAIATLKAMGFTNGFIAWTVLEQACVIALGGYAAGLALAALAYHVLGDRTALAIDLSWPRATALAAGCLVACLAAGMLAAAKAARIPPAELF